MDSAPATVEQISNRLADVRQRIDASRRSDQDVSIVAVTKTFGVDLVAHGNFVFAHEVFDDFTVLVVGYTEADGIVSAKRGTA